MRRERNQWGLPKKLHKNGRPPKGPWMVEGGVGRVSLGGRFFFKEGISFRSVEGRFLLGV